MGKIILLKQIQKELQHSKFQKILKLENIPSKPAIMVALLKTSLLLKDNLTSIFFVFIIGILDFNYFYFVNFTLKYYIAFVFNLRKF